MHTSCQYIGFNTDRSADKWVKQAGVQNKVIGDLCSDNNKLSNNCQVKGKNTNLYSYNVTDTGSLVNKSEGRSVHLCRENSKFQTSSMLENVNKFACLHQVSDKNILTLDADNSAVDKCVLDLHNNDIQDVVTESSN